MLPPSSRGFEAPALLGHAPFPRPRVSPPLPPSLGGGAGLQHEECRLGARRPGHIPGETPGPGGKFAQLHAQLRLGAGEGTHTNSLSSSLLFGADWLAENPGGWWCASQSPGPETQRAGKGCLRGPERGEREGR